MKKVLFLAVIAVVSCGSKFGEGGDNAAQYVREQMPELTKDAASVEAVKCDTFGICDIQKVMRELELKELEAESQVIKYSDLSKFVDSIDMYAYNDKRLLYTVVVTAKSNKRDSIKVIMDKDGIAPQMLYNEYIKKHEPLAERKANAWASLDIVEDLEE